MQLRTANGLFKSFDTLFGGGFPAERCEPGGPSRPRLDAELRCAASCVLRARFLSWPTPLLRD